MLARLAAMILLFVSCASHAEEVQPSLNITTRSSGTMFASDFARHELGLPNGDFAYELVLTTTVERARMNWHDPLSFYAPGKGSVTLTVGGISHTFRDFDNWLDISAQFYSSQNNPGTDVFSHDAYIGSYYGFGLTGFHLLRWPAGQVPVTQAFVDQSWTFDGPAVGEAYFNLVAGGQRAGYIMGTANHVEMSISAVPEPSRVMLLLAGLGLATLAGRRQRRLIPYRQG